MIRLFFVFSLLFVFIFPSVSFSAPARITYIFGEKLYRIPTPSPSGNGSDDSDGTDPDDKKNPCEEQQIENGIPCGDFCCLPGLLPYCSSNLECVQCPEGKHYSNGICCPNMQINVNGVCACEIHNKTVCGDNCCVEGETCYNNTTCCAGVLCGETCCSTDEICGVDNQCVCSNGNPKNSDGVCCPDGQVEVDYFDKTGVRKQTCCAKGAKGADWGGNCCGEGKVGTFGHDHNSRYISRCCPIEGQEDKGMVGLLGLSETYSCAPPDTTMKASGWDGRMDHAWYVPIGSDNVYGNGLACAPGTNPRSILHSGCATGFYCTHNASSSGCYCSGTVENGKCILPDCTLKRQHIAYCYCNPAKGSVMEHGFQGGTWSSDYVLDVCVTPQTDVTDLSPEELCKSAAGEMYWSKGLQKCHACADWVYYSGVEREDCDACPNRYWQNTANKYCLECDDPGSNGYYGYIPYSECQRCPNRFWYISGGVEWCRLCPNNEKSTENGKACPCPSDQFWSTGSNACLSCLYNGLSTYVTKESCARCPNRYWYYASDLGYCGICPSGANASETGESCVCPSGQFWNKGGSGGSNVCSACSATAGVYGPVESCHLCDNQFAIVNPTDGLERCYGCDEPTYSVSAVNKTTFAECKRCPKRYLDKNGYCRICLDAYYCPLDENGADAVICPAGNYCPKGSHEPIPCPSDTYRATTGAYAVTHCVACPAGKTPNEERTACI